ncbi:hypothetical protein HX776_10805 [Pseudomonas agarici]|uniref:hypothetical protein n=1 Tax=Pseudomonas agarici TaxID=46677 RepID=UPI0003195F7D|nr:hypothetical protein [Pseudomonas agarici]NWC09304.1 hypothetical protein [Pseudomonas agarici]SEL45858.1 hypothetical protein SAMN05216604_1192 [Pseudomonas agarici]
MPEIKCEFGHKQSIGTDAWVATLTLDQMRYARDQIAEKIKAAEAQPKRTVWRVSNGTFCEGSYREEEFEKAADHLLRIYKAKFMDEAPCWIEKPCGYLTFERQLPSLSPELVTQHEYDTEWFPAKP